jgi:hypothetical protein
MDIHFKRPAPGGAAAFALIALVALGACNKENSNQLAGPAPGAAPCPADPSSASSGASTSSSTTGASSSSGGGDPADAGPGKTVLDDRVVSYTDALRTASFKLIGNAPDVAVIESLTAASDQKAAYEAAIDKLFADKRFAARMVDFWKNTMRMGGAAQGAMPSRDAAPTFAARIVVEGKPYTDLFTASENTCPTFNPATGEFTDGSCKNGDLETAGILTDAGVQAHYFGSLGFRRIRFIQEVFTCRRMPAELSATPVPMGAGNYTAPWPFDSIAGAANGGRIDFLDTTSSLCSNCHATMNHRAPLFAVFDENGKYVAPAGAGQDTEYSVLVPIDGAPKAKLSDYLPAGQTTAWKFGAPAATMKELGQAMAADEEVTSCAVIRMWNYAMSKGDVVNNAATVPSVVISPLVEDFKANGYNLRATLRAIFVHDDFVRF